MKKNQKRLFGEQEEILNNRESTIKYYIFAGFFSRYYFAFVFIIKPIKLKSQFLGIKDYSQTLAKEFYERP